MYLIDNQPKVQIRLNNATIVNQLYQALVLNIEDDSKVKVLMQPMFNSATELQIYLDSPRIAQRLGTFGVELIRIGKMYLVAVEKGMSREKEYFPIDSIHINGDFKFTTLGLIEKIKVLATCAKHYRINVRCSITAGKTEFPNFGTVGISSIATHQSDQWTTIPSYFAPLRPMRPLRGQPLYDPKGFEEVGAKKDDVKFWQEVGLDGDTFKNTTFDKSVSLKTHIGGYHNRDAKVSTPSVDPIHGDDFSNRSFDRQFSRQTARTPEEISAHETFALSAHHIDHAHFDVNRAGLAVKFDGEKLLFPVSDTPVDHPTSCAFVYDSRNGHHTKFVKYLMRGGEHNLVEKLRFSQGFDLSAISISTNSSLIVVGVDTVSAKLHNQVGKLFAELKSKARLPRCADTGKVADVELEDNTPIPKKSSNLFIRIKDEGVFIDVNGVGHEVQVKAWDDKSLLLVSSVIDRPSGAELKMLATTIKANYGGKAKGDIEVFIGENHVGERGLVLVLGLKPRFSHLRSMLEKHLVK